MNGLISILYRDAPDRDAVKRLYRSAFPKAERSPWRRLVRLSGSGACEFRAYYEENALVGLTVVIERETFVYLFFLAVDGSMRSRGYGGSILEETVARYSGKCTVLDMEKRMLGNEQRMRRFSFYGSHGFYPTGFEYTFRGVSYETLCRGSGFSAAEYAAFLRERLKTFKN